MDFEKLITLPTGTKVDIFIPVFPNQFFTVGVQNNGDSVCLHNDEPLRSIDGHRKAWHLHSQKDVDAFFYIRDKGKLTDEDYLKGLEHFKNNGKEWIF
ncbi:hypothetical protein [Flavobacterium psychrotrophum]|uniref:hypothetical protein n=1 Tax=Flavobacterium psychrotrophum TaxID=2294119 RepID=UPI000E31AAA0|nr:hypothetical protein [Flavobacterium psychrotrophum]